MLRRTWRPLAVAAVVGPPIYWYYSRRSLDIETFDITVREVGPDGKSRKTVRTIPMLSKNAVDALIREHATLENRRLSDGRIWRVSTAYLASNDPIEDRNAYAVIPKSPLLPSERLYVAVMDGHAGFHTSQLLSRALIPAVAAELAEASKPPPLPSLFQKLLSAFSSQQTFTMTASTEHPSPEQVSRAIQTAFSELDYEIVTAPLKLFAANLNQNSLKQDAIPDLSDNKLALAALQPALSGSCALMAILDPSSQNMHVACTGDARAVAGFWEDGEDGKGRWRVEVLSEDQTGRNPNELSRIRSEHPPEEADHVVMRGRILGGLEPSRAFGDARYKWPVPLQEALSKAFSKSNSLVFRSPPSLLKTPPYVTATPVVTHRKMSLPLPGLTSASSSSSMRFVVLATDGLWDQLSSKEAVLLVGGYLQGLKGTVPKSSLPLLVLTNDGTKGIDGKETRGREQQDGSWAFVDDNISAHLIRNAFGGGDEVMLRQMLSIPAPYSRRYRDDITVTVVWWDEDGREEQQVSTNTPDQSSATNYSFGQQYGR
ncbi:protein serine/threonine phosphatase 2C [Vararia minispora EC-137]|uniref:Protein serine/threonine phosphatase 2C n=1 Tax=Vararia minispora EC-137 TaxID=1314806 RepID=A0ACB8QQ21_9AGAM|nr:protein serine/threonine phosphatase 2C [Vararia minispora EC-137]